PLRELLEQPLERWTAFARDTLRLAGQPEAYSVLERPDDDGLLLLERRSRHQERGRHTLGILQASREVDEHLPSHAVSPFRRISGEWNRSLHRVQRCPSPIHRSSWLPSAPTYTRG